jgi:hypothetical protein
MMRQAHRWRTALLRAQAERKKRGPDPAAGDIAAPAELTVEEFVLLVGLATRPIVSSHAS